MAARAAAMGVHLHWATAVRAMHGGGFASRGASRGAAIQADFFVIADGLCSTLAVASGFRERGCYSARYASRQQFQRAPWSDCVEVHWRPCEQLYVTPLGDDEVGVALLTDRRGRKLSDALPDFPAVANRLAGAAATSSMRGAVTRTRGLREVIRGNIAVLGDASGSVDAVTGEGLLSALRQAHALADAIAAGEPQRYAAAHRQISQRPRRMARLLLLLDRYPWLERQFVARMAKRPESFAALLRVHLAEESWTEFAWNELAMCWRAAPLPAGIREAKRNSAGATRRNTWLPHAAGSDRERGL
jgi:flavin-dependent dehydrogenase